MKKIYVSFALTGALVASMNAVEVNPFGHLGAFYHQGFGGLPTQNQDAKEVQAAYGNISARVGVDIGLGSDFSIGLGAWGGYPFYSTGNANAPEGNVGDRAFPKKGDISDAYLRYDGGNLSFVLGRFDIGQFYLGKDGKNYTGVDWIYGNVQGGALNVGSKALSLWAYWRNSQLGTGEAYGRMGYELSSFNSYQHYKTTSKVGELVSAGLDVNLGGLKISPFVSYLTDSNTSIDVPKGEIGIEDVLNAGAKVQFDIGNGGLQSSTILRVVYGARNIVGDAKSTNGLTFWVDEEIRLYDIWKVGAGYINQNKDANLLNYGDRTRFYGYRGGLSGPTFGNSLGISDEQSTWYVFGGLDSKRLALDLLYAGGNYKEVSAVVSVKIWEASDKTYLSVGGGYVGTAAQTATLYRKLDAYQHSAFGFVKFAF